MACAASAAVATVGLAVSPAAAVPAAAAATAQAGKVGATLGLDVIAAVTRTAFGEGATVRPA